MIKIHEYIDKRRREWLEGFRTTTEEAREKQVFNQKIFCFSVLFSCLY